MTNSEESVPLSDRVAEVSARADARHAHHEAGHAVAAVYRGGVIKEIVLGTSDWTRVDGDTDTPGWVEHFTHPNNQPFVTYAGPWAEATWTMMNEPGNDDFTEALLLVWDSNWDGDTGKYEGAVAQVEQLAHKLGLGSVGRAWERDWEDELDYLWPVICEIATALTRGESVTHQVVEEAVDRHREQYPA